ncbi:2339_t:CDS:2, partial [Funneliformis caledonium]
MSNKNFSKRPHYEINSDLEENTPNEELNLNKESNGFPEKSNSVLSSLDENDKKNKSAVWDHFDKFVDNKGVIWAKCQYCLGGKYNMSSGSSTGNLNRHLKSHPEKIDPIIAKQAELMKKFLQSDDKI